MIKVLLRIAESDTQLQHDFNELNKHQNLVTVEDHELIVRSAESLSGQLVASQFEISNNNSLDLYDADMIGRWSLISDEIYEFYHDRVLQQEVCIIENTSC